MSLYEEYVVAQRAYEVAHNRERLARAEVVKTSKIRDAALLPFLREWWRVKEGDLVLAYVLGPGGRDYHECLVKEVFVVFRLGEDPRMRRPSLLLRKRLQSGKWSVPATLNDWKHMDAEVADEVKAAAREVFLSGKLRKRRP